MHKLIKAIWLSMMRQDEYMATLQSQFGIAYGVRSWRSRPEPGAGTSVAFHNAFTSVYARSDIETCGLSVEIIQQYYKSRQKRAAGQVSYVVSSANILEDLGLLLGEDQFNALFTKPPTVIKLSDTIYIASFWLNRAFKSHSGQRADQLLFLLLTHLGYRPDIEHLIAYVTHTRGAQAPNPQLPQPQPTLNNIDTLTGLARVFNPVYTRAINQCVQGLSDFMPTHTDKTNLIDAQAQLAHWVALINEPESTPELIRLSHSYLIESLNLILNTLEPYQAQNLENLLSQWISQYIPATAHSLLSRPYLATSGMQALLLAIASARTLHPNAQVLVLKDSQGCDYITDELSEILTEANTAREKSGTYIMSLGANTAAPSLGWSDIIEQIKQSAKENRITLILDITLEFEPGSLSRLMDALVDLIASGAITCFLCKSMQKYMTLGTAKVRAGVLFYLSQYSAQDANVLTALTPYEIPSRFKTIPNIQFTTHILSHCLDIERQLIEHATQMQVFIAETCIDNAALQPTDPNTGPFFSLCLTEAQQHQLALMGVVLEKSYGSPSSSFWQSPTKANPSDACVFNPGQETKPQLIEYFYAIGHYSKDLFSDAPSPDRFTEVFQSLAQANDYNANKQASLLLSGFAAIHPNTSHPMSETLLGLTEPWLASGFPPSITANAQWRLIEFWSVHAMARPSEHTISLLKRQLPQISFVLRRHLLTQVIPEDYFDVPQNLIQIVQAWSSQLSVRGASVQTRPSFAFKKGYELVRLLIKDFEPQDTLDLIEQQVSAYPQPRYVMIIDALTQKLGPKQATSVAWFEDPASAQQKLPDPRQRLRRIISNFVL